MIKLYSTVCKSFKKYTSIHLSNKCTLILPPDNVQHLIGHLYTLFSPCLLYTAVILVQLILNRRPHFTRGHGRQVACTYNAHEATNTKCVGISLLSSKNISVELFTTFLAGQQTSVQTHLEKSGQTEHI